MYRTVQRNGTDYIVTSGADGRFRVEELPRRVLSMGRQFRNRRTRCMRPWNCRSSSLSEDNLKTSSHQQRRATGHAARTAGDTVGTSAETAGKRNLHLPPKNRASSFRRPGTKYSFVDGAGIMLTVVGGVIYGRKGEDAERK